MATIGEAGNTFYPPLVVLKSKGYRLRATYTGDPPEEPYYTAIKDGHEFAAFSPEGLLGIVCIWEQFGEHWQEAIRDVDFDEVETLLEDEEGNVTREIEYADGRVEKIVDRF